ncbi:MAG: SH3 domain-containing protein [Geminocystis sp.]|nr:SH3 domain-containing protein [Geminocystis sp.]HIK36758.1 SH3 domain-containing protein [Geminocystis sp. M7585_C2015_104]MCS7148508.1 SH3 domain-containing protein [Geminocystis sp.]MCX8079464.1 SH3 domain-containing protein [Geminocystis sp.]MDW8114919.1 SH3 domain-containing protein [Geminocystis sp.]
MKRGLGGGIIGVGLGIAFSLGMTPKAVMADTAFVMDPPSNVRVVPNGRILCVIPSRVNINVYGYDRGWYLTDACGTMGYIHESQVRLAGQGRGRGDCVVVGLKRGQLALRKSPGGESVAGLNNGNTVDYLAGDFPWYYVRVVSGPNRRVTGMEGWVNANYLYCGD